MRARPQDLTVPPGFALVLVLRVDTTLSDVLAQVVKEVPDVVQLARGYERGRMSIGFGHVDAMRGVHALRDGFAIALVTAGKIIWCRRSLCS